MTEQILPMAQQQQPTTSLSTQEYQSLAEEIGQVVVLAKVKIRRWRGNYALKDARVKVGDAELAVGDGVSAPHTKILPERWERAFNAVEGRLRRAVTRHAMPIKTYTPYQAQDGTTQYLESVDDDDHVVPKEFAGPIRSEVEQLKLGEWDPLVEKFLGEYEEVVASYAKDRPAEYARVSHLLPASAEAARPAFSVRLSERPLGLSADDLTREALERGAGDYLATVRESIFRGAADGLKASVEYLLARLADKAAVKKSTLDNVSSAIALFRSVADLMPAGDLVPLLKRAEDLVAGHSVQELNRSTLHGVDDLSGRLSSALGAVARSVDAAELLDKAQRRQRKIAL